MSTSLPIVRQSDAFGRILGACRSWANALSHAYAGIRPLSHLHSRGVWLVCKSAPGADPPTAPLWRRNACGCGHCTVCPPSRSHSQAFAFIRSCRLLSQLARRVCTRIHRRTGPRALRDRQRVHRRAISFAACPNRVRVPGPCVPPAGAKPAIAWFTLFLKRLNCKSKETA